MEIPKTDNPEFDNLLRLLSSIDEPNVRLGLQLARNFPTEIEEHFGYSYQNLGALFEFLMQYEAWYFDTPFFKMRTLHLAGKSIFFLPKQLFLLKKISYMYLHENQIQTIPTEIRGLQNLSKLHIENNQLQTLPIEIGYLQNLSNLALVNNQLKTLPAEVGKLKKLKALHLNDNPLQSLPEELCNLKNTKIYISGTPENMFIPEKLKEMGTLIYEE